MSVFANTVDGNIVGGLFGTRQNETQTEFADDAPEVLAFMNSLAINNPIVAEQERRNVAKEIFEAIPGPVEKAFRATSSASVEENNAIRQWIMGFKQAVAASTSWADFKSKIAASPDLPDRNMQQYKNVIINRIDAGA